jgi:hypothetical protein
VSIASLKSETTVAEQPATIPQATEPASP